jgi:hypothetical protein
LRSRPKLVNAVGNVREGRAALNLHELLPRKGIELFTVRVEVYYLAFYVPCWETPFVGERVKGKLHLDEFVNVNGVLAKFAESQQLFFCGLSQIVAVNFTNECRLIAGPATDETSPFGCLTIHGELLFAFSEARTVVEGTVTNEFVTADFWFYAVTFEKRFPLRL